MEGVSLRSESPVETVDDKDSLTQSQEQVMSGGGIALQIQPTEQVRALHRRLFNERHISR